MARTVPVRFSTSMKDSWGISASQFVWAMVDPTATVGDLQTALSTYTTDLDGCTDAQIIKNDIFIQPAIPTTGIKTAPVAVSAGGAPVEQTGVVNFIPLPTVSNKRWGLNIPAVSNKTTVLNGTDRILGLTAATAGDPVGVLIALLTTVTTLIAYANDHQQEIAAVKDALVGFHKRRKQLQRSSFEVPS